VLDPVLFGCWAGVVPLEAGAGVELGVVEPDLLCGAGAAVCDWGAAVVLCLLDEDFEDADVLEDGKYVVFGALDCSWGAGALEERYCVEVPPELSACVADDRRYVVVVAVGRERTEVARARAGVAFAREVCDRALGDRALDDRALDLCERSMLAGTCTTTKPDRAAPWNQPAPPPGLAPDVPKKWPLIDMYT